MAQYVFDEQALIDLIEGVIKDAFNTSEFATLFGGNKMQIYNSITVEKPKFPAVVVSIRNAVPYEQFNTASDCEHYSTFTIEIEHYNQAVGSNSKEKIGRIINKTIKDAIQTAHQLLFVYNEELASPDRTIYRRLLRINGVFDNATQTFYREI